MNDQDPSFDDPSYDEIRHLLADARATEPVPADVLARLDATLADLTADRRADVSDSDGVVVPLRRRRTGPRLLVAAAAVLVIAGGGFTVNQVLRDDTLSADSTTAAGAPSTTADQPESAPQVPAPATPDTVTGQVAGGGSRSAASAIAALHTATFSAEVAALVVPESGDVRAPQKNLQLDRGTTPAPTAPDNPAGLDSLGSAYSEEFGDSLGGTATAAKACTGPVGTDGTRYPIKLDGRPAVLVVHPEVDGSRLVEAWSCDGTTVLANASLTD